MKKNILSIILATIMLLAVCPAYAEASGTAGDYIINDDFSNSATARPWLAFSNTDKTGNAGSVTDGTIKVVRGNTTKPYARIYFNDDKSPITKPTAISFTVSREGGVALVFKTDGSQVFTFWNDDNSIRPRTYTVIGGKETAGSTGAYTGPVTVTYVIDPILHKYSMWVNGTKKVTNSYLQNADAINYMSVVYNDSDNGNYTVDDVKVWEFVKEDATYSGEGYNNGNLQAGDIELSLPISYIPNGTDNKVTVIMAAYDNDTNELIAISDIEEHTFDGADFFTFTPEMTIPQTAGEYYVKTMTWKSGTLVPLCAADVLGLD